MNIAIMGANSHLATDLILQFAIDGQHNLQLFSRCTDAMCRWLADAGITNTYSCSEYAVFPKQSFDAILNFVGVGDPSQAAVMGAGIFDVTLEYDSLALSYLRAHPECRYIFMSSGAVYGGNFSNPVTTATPAILPINALLPHDWYCAAKLHAECRHRALTSLPIVDIRVFNYFSRTNDLKARFFITDVLRAVRDKTVLHTTSDNMWRDFVGPRDFQQLISCILAAPAQNLAIDCYTRAPIDKLGVLSLMQQHFGLCYQTDLASVGSNATGNKPHYYSVSRRAADLGYTPYLDSSENLVAEALALLSSFRIPSRLGVLPPPENAPFPA